ELTPHTAILIIDVLDKLGLPAGVANLVLGAGATAGGPLSTHADVDMVSFTGGLHTGRKLMAGAAETVKKVALELGGKNPNVVFADADFDAAVDNALNAAFVHSGQVCSAGARLIVEESIAGEFTDELAHREKVTQYVQDGIAEGARLRCGGQWGTGELEQGYYYLPTVLDQVERGMSVVVEEGFGPVVTVETFSDEDEAVATANDTHYGLA